MIDRIRKRSTVATLIGVAGGMLLLTSALPAPAAAGGLDGVVNVNLAWRTTRVADCFVEGTFGPCYDVRAYAHPIALALAPGNYAAQGYIKEHGQGNSNVCFFLSPLDTDCEHGPPATGNNVLRVLHPWNDWCVSTHGVLRESLLHLGGIVDERDGASGCWPGP